MLLTDARVVTPVGVRDPGWVRIVGDRIAEVGSGSQPRGPAGQRHELPGRWLVPGFIDLHVHGGGGHAMLSPDPTEIGAAASFHRSHGTTRSLASVVSAPFEDMLAGVAAIRNVVRGGAASAGQVMGSHLEGPFLNPRRSGAHDPRHLLAPNPAAFDRLLEAADGTLRVITIAPELPGGLDLVRRAVAAGVIVAVGHSDANHAQAIAAFEAGASLVTHLFNGMRPFDHRQPGLVGAALTYPGVVCEIINDGIHLHDATTRLAFEAAGSRRIALVTDAVAAAGVGDGAFQLGSATVLVRDGEVRLADGETLAGSTLTMDSAVRRAVRMVGLPITAAVEAASTTPARLLGIGDRVGSIESGRQADLVVMTDDLAVEAVMAAGEWTTSARLAS